LARHEFTVAGAPQFNRKGPIRWIASHMARNKRPFFFWIFYSIGATTLLSATRPLTGAAFTEILRPHPDISHLVYIALALLAFALIGGGCDITARFSAEFLADRTSRDARDELYLNLLGKSQTFHNRQRVGDIMARANDDISLLGQMINPGLDLILDSTLGLVIPLIFIGFINVQLLVIPLIFTVLYVIALRGYTRELDPVTTAQRNNFGNLNAGLAETITGIDVVKSTAQEASERAKYTRNARAYRDAYVRNGQIQARYLPPLILAVTTVAAFAHGVFLLTQGVIGIGDLVAFMGLLIMLRFPTFISIFSFSLVQLGAAASQRILAIMREETELDENENGHQGVIQGQIAFEGVTFSYGGEPILRDVSFTASPGQTVAIVGQTGTGKSTLTKLVNRTYDVTGGRVLVDGVDVRDWALDSLRAQISTIEQDIFLFSRTIAENIAFSRGQHVSRAEIERAARDAQADEFILGFKDGYETMVGERGVTLSGGQRQRLAIARALVTNPRILILDDSTSAVDSATEDEIQKAIRRLLEGRTTLLITHRLSQIRWADKILVLDKGQVIDQGTHDELLARCALYRRIFAFYDEVPAAAVAVGEE
jgi:ATP-binding cassette subfamily B protein